MRKNMSFIAILFLLISCSINNKVNNRDNPQKKFYKNVMKYDPCEGKESHTYFFNFPPPDDRIYVIQIREINNGQKKIYFEGTDRIGLGIFAPDYEANLSDDEFNSAKKIFSEISAIKGVGGNDKNLGRLSYLVKKDGECKIVEDFCEETNNAYTAKMCVKYDNERIKVNDFPDKIKAFVEQVFKNNKTVNRLKNYEKDTKGD